MLYTIAEISDLIGLSKVTIYKKLKLKEMQEHISKKQGTTYVTEEGFNFIKLGLNGFNTDTSTEPQEDTKNVEDIILEDDIKDLNKDLINALIEQLKEKDKQIETLHNLIENSQILLKSKSEEVKLLEEPVKAKVSLFTKFFK